MPYLDVLRAIPTLAEVEGPFPSPAAAEDAYWANVAPEQTCAVCDALGHGYPGAGPCPLEERGRYYDPPELF